MALVRHIFWGGTDRSALRSPQHIPCRGLCSGGCGLVILLLAGCTSWARVNDNDNDNDTDTDNDTTTTTTTITTTTTTATTTTTSTTTTTTTCTNNNNNNNDTNNSNCRAPLRGDGIRSGDRLLRDEAIRFLSRTK